MQPSCTSLKQGELKGGRGGGDQRERERGLKSTCEEGGKEGGEKEGRRMGRRGRREMGIEG